MEILFWLMDHQHQETLMPDLNDYLVNKNPKVNILLIIDCRSLFQSHPFAIAQLRAKTAWRFVNFLQKPQAPRSCKATRKTPNDIIFQVSLQVDGRKHLQSLQHAHRLQGRGGKMEQSLRKAADGNQAGAEKGRGGQESGPYPIRRIRQHPGRRVAPLRQPLGRHCTGVGEMAIKKVAPGRFHKENQHQDNRPP